MHFLIRETLSFNLMYVTACYPVGTTISKTSSLFTALLQHYTYLNYSWTFKSLKHKHCFILATVLSAKSDSDVIFCLQSYQGLMIDSSIVY